MKNVYSSHGIQTKHGIGDAIIHEGSIYM